MIKNSSANTGDTGDMGSTPGLGKKKMATYSSILIWKIP